MPVPIVSARNGNCLMVMNETCSLSLLVGFKVLSLIAEQRSLVNSFLKVLDSLPAFSPSVTLGVY